MNKNKIPKTFHEFCVRILGITGYNAFSIEERQKRKNQWKYYKIAKPDIKFED